MLTLWHARVDDLPSADAYALTGPPNPGRAALAAALFDEHLYDLVATYRDLNDDGDALHHVIQLTRHDPSLPRGTMTGDVVQASNGGTVTARYVVDVTGWAAMPLAAIVREPLAS